MFILKVLATQLFLLDAATDAAAAAAAAATKKTEDENKAKGGDAEELKNLKSQHASLLERLDKLEKSASGPTDKSKDDLTDKLRQQKEADTQKAGDTKKLEAALQFTMGAEQFIKNNESLLPKDIAEIFKLAEKEKYENAIQKRDAIQAGVINSFFSQQANLDLLTPNQKTVLADYQKLTKNVKEERAAEIYDNIFEPAVEMLRRIKKAEQLGKSGGVSSSDADTAYKNKLMEISQKHYLGATDAKR